MSEHRRVEKSLRDEDQPQQRAFVGMVDSTDRTHRGFGDAFDPSAPGAGRLVLLPVGRWDIRATAALHVAGTIPAEEQCAVHVATDQHWIELGERWQLESGGMPLVIVDAAGRRVAGAVRDMVAIELMHYREVVVIIGRLDLVRRRSRLLHARTADEISRVLAAVPHTYISCVGAGRV